MRLAPEPNVHWYIVKEWARDVGMGDPNAFFRQLAGQAFLSGYYWRHLAGADIVVFVDVIMLHANHERSVSSSYREVATMLTHTLLHEYLHHERVEEALAILHPRENPHILIDEWLRDKVLLPLEQERDDTCLTAPILPATWEPSSLPPSP